MKPSNKEEYKIASLEFPQVDFSKIRIFKRKGYETKKGITCMKCGETFTSLNKNKCPKCGENLDVEKTRKQTHKESKYMQVVTTNEEFQVIRVYLASLTAKKGKEEIINIVEVMRWFITPKGTIKVMTIPTSQVYYEWRWVLWKNEWAFRKQKDRYGFNKFLSEMGKVEITHPKIRFTDKFKYCGLTRKSKLDAVRYFELYMKYPEIEILSKLGYHDLIKGFYDSKKVVNDYTRELKTIIKNKYKPTDIGIWIDYIDLLKFFGKDTTAIKYCCPEDLLKAHDKLLEKKSREICSEDHTKYEAHVKKFKDIDIGNGEISISVISNLEQMKYEANLLHLCYIASKYYKKESSIILSAKVKGVPTEGIEIDIITRQVIQIRGKNNRDSIYHEKIKKLVEKNINLLFRQSQEQQKQSRELCVA